MAVYLDNASTTFPKPACVAEAVYKYLTEVGGNGQRGDHALSYAADELLYNCRCRLAEIFHAEAPQQVIFTKNVTEALNLFLFGLLQPNDHVLLSPLEHNAVLRPLELLRSRGVTYSFLPCAPDGLLLLDELDAYVQENTVLLLVNHASNVCGTVQPLEELAAFCCRHRLLFAVDAAQSAGLVPIDMKKSQLAALAFTGHKALLGPMGTGGLILSGEIGRRLQPLIAGGTGSKSHLYTMPDFLPDRLEAGTLNLPGLAGLYAALGWLEKAGIDAIREKELALTQLFLEGLRPLEEEKKLVILGRKDCRKRLGVVSVRLLKKDQALAAQALAQDYGIYTRVGLHCAPAAHKALGSFPEGSIRFSFGNFNSEEDVRAALKALGELCRPLFPFN